MFIIDSIRCGAGILMRCVSGSTGRPIIYGALWITKAKWSEVFVTKRRDRRAALEFLNACDEALWPTGFDRHGQATVISCCDEGDRQ